MRANFGGFLGVAVVSILYGGCGSNGGGTTSQGISVDPDAGAGGADGAPNPSTRGNPSSPCRVVGDETRVTQTQSAAKTPFLTWTGSDYLVVWSDDRNGAGDIYAARISATGMLEGPEWAIATTPTASTSPILVAVPGGFLAGWQEGDVSGGAFLNQLLTPDGRPKAGTFPTPVALSQAGEIRPRLAAAFDGVVAGWVDQPSNADGGSSPTSQSAAWIAGLDMSGSVLRPPDPVLLGGGAAATSFPALAANSSLLAAAYVDFRAGHGDLRVGLFGSGLSPSADILVRDAPGDASSPSAIWDGNQFVLAWEDLRSGDDQVYLARIGADGTVEAGLPVPDPDTGSANWPRLASSAGSTVVAFYQFRDGPPQVYLSLFGPDGSKMGGDLLVSQGITGKARFPSVVRGTTEYAIGWEDTRFGNSQVFLARVSCP